MKKNKHIKRFNESTDTPSSISYDSHSFTIQDLENAFEAGADMKDCKSEFDFERRGYEPYSSFDEWLSKNFGK